MKASFPVQGGCACGGLRYQMLRSPLFVNCCHCRWCQRETGSAFVLNAMLEAGEVEILTGEPETIDTPSNSGKGQKISRCPDCKVAVWSNYAGAGDAIRFIRVGTLDDPDQFPPSMHVFTLTKQPWVVIPEDQPAVDEFYHLPDHWPAESMERIKALKE